MPPTLSPFFSKSSSKCNYKVYDFCLYARSCSKRSLRRAIPFQFFFSVSLLLIIWWPYMLAYLCFFCACTAAARFIVSMSKALSSPLLVSPLLFFSSSSRLDSSFFGTSDSVRIVDSGSSRYTNENLLASGIFSSSDSSSSFSVSSFFIYRGSFSSFREVRKSISLCSTIRSTVFLGYTHSASLIF